MPKLIKLCPNCSRIVPAGTSADFPMIHYIRIFISLGPTAKKLKELIDIVDGSSRNEKDQRDDEQRKTKIQKSNPLKQKILVK